eukprot:3134286-Prymnesium_polylepis.1
MDGPDGWVPIHSSAYGVSASTSKSSSLDAARRPTRDSGPRRPHSYVLHVARSVSSPVGTPRGVESVLVKRLGARAGSMPGKPSFVYLRGG